VRYVITGASMRTYLLEKSRVVYQSEGERNYHIFYQMCASRKHHAELGELFLEDADKFNYLGGSRAALAERNIDDSACFRETFEAMNLLGFGIDDRRMFFKVSELYSFSCRKLGLNLNVSEKNTGPRWSPPARKRRIRSKLVLRRRNHSGICYITAAAVLFSVPMETCVVLIAKFYLRNVCDKRKRVEENFLWFPWQRNKNPNTKLQNPFLFVPPLL
jgi:hypothetical protein